jgi:peptide/nickel transport system substrate-binding protein
MTRSIFWQGVRFVVIFAVISCLCASFEAQARDLVIAIRKDAITLDPHFIDNSPNNTALRHIYDSLVGRDNRLQPVPSLAVSWHQINPLTWRFKIREGVHFHDGSPFQVEDAAASIERAQLNNREGSYTAYVRSVDKVQVLDPQTLEITTREADPLLPNRLTNIFVVKRMTRNQGREVFDSGDGAIGTGPYRYQERIPGKHLIVTANPQHWRGPPQWEKVTILAIPDSAERVAALLTRKADVIDQVPPARAEELSQEKGIRVFSSTSVRLIFLHMDQARDQTPFVSDSEGRPLTVNPFKDRRVRRAFSKAINRKGIVEDILSGQAVPAGQLLPDGYFGVKPEIGVEAYDPAGARALLAEAGYGKGFRVTLHCPMDRYQGDQQICQRLKLLLARAGIQVTPVAMPWVEFMPSLLNHDFSFMLMGWATITGETSFALNALLATNAPGQGRGGWNAGRYSNPRLDALIEASDASTEVYLRERRLHEAMALVAADQGIIPLHFQVNTWAVNETLRYAGTVDENTLATYVFPANSP